MTSFAALMALSATQTRQSEAAVQSQLAERERRQAALRKQQEEKERKEREMEAKLRKKVLEEAQREKERQERLEAERRAKEATLRRKEEEQRDALRYGPKRTGAGYPASSGGARNDVRRQRMPESDDEGGGGGLTREEKRQMRLKRELNYGTSAAKRGITGGYRKSGRRLPGGAVDTDAVAGSSTAGGYRSVRDRLAHEPPGLIKLNVNKRDTRTIDEILQDRAKAKAKILSGEEAKQFDNWFGKSKAKTASRAASPPSSIFSSRSPSPAHEPPPASQALNKALPRTTKSLSGTPPAASRPIPQTKASTSSMFISKSSAPLVSKGSGVSVKPVGRPVEKSVTSVSTSSKPANGKTPVKTVTVNGKNPSSTSSRATVPASKQSAGPSRPSASAMKKRARSRSFSESPPPPKRRGAPAGNSISAEIWKMFGKDRDAYVARDVYSDDEDMEAGARDLESEELYSAKIARREDEMAIEEEKRHEEEKRRRKKERDFRERRG